MSVVFRRDGSVALGRCLLLAGLLATVSGCGSLLSATASGDADGMRKYLAKGADLDERRATRIRASTR